MAVPQVVIVGRPNVGKSSIFNWFAGHRVAIVDDMAGVTRDRLTYLIHERSHFFEIVDTGGIGIDDVDNLTKEIEQQIENALEMADVVLFVVDTRSGITPLDEQVAKRLRYVDKPIICVANKADDPKLDPQADEFYRLGRGKLIRVSAHQNRNKQQLLNLITERLPDEPTLASIASIAAEPEEAVMKVTIAGRQNVGKSTFVNTLARGERMIVSEIPGTTRDSVDVRFEIDGQVLVAIDTPGLRRKKSIKTDVEFYGLHRAQRSIRRADVVLMFFDATQRISKVDKQLCKYVTDNFKPCIFVVNKWDTMVGKMPTEKWVQYLRDNFRTMWHVPIAFITGETGKNVKALLNHSQMLYKQTRQRVTTGELNRLIQRAVEHQAPPLYRGRRPKIFYASQVSVQPPTMVLVVNYPKAFSPHYLRYLLGVFRDQLSFGEVPIKMYLHPRSRGDDRDEIRSGKAEMIDQVDGSEQVPVDS